MTKAIIVVILILAFGCKPKWGREKVFNECMDNAKKHYDMSKGNNKIGSETICNCIADKMISKFKTEEEANKSPVDAFTLGDDCKRDYAKILK